MRYLFLEFHQVIVTSLFLVTFRKLRQSSSILCKNQAIGGTSFFSIQSFLHKIYSVHLENNRKLFGFVPNHLWRCFFFWLLISIFFKETEGEISTKLDESIYNVRTLNKHVLFNFVISWDYEVKTVGKYKKISSFLSLMCHTFWRTQFLWFCPSQLLIHGTAFISQRKNTWNRIFKVKMGNCSSATSYCGTRGRNNCSVFPIILSNVLYLFFYNSRL